MGRTGFADGGWMFNFAIPKGVPREHIPAVAEFARGI